MKGSICFYAEKIEQISSEQWIGLDGWKDIGGVGGGKQEGTGVICIMGKIAFKTTNK